MENFEEKAYLCALNRIFGFEPRLGRALIEHCGGASEVFTLDDKEKDIVLGPFSKYRGIINNKAVDQAREELTRLTQKGIYFCGYTEDDFPQLLLECEDHPIGLYIKTSTPIKDLWGHNSIAVVGTRDISPYGKEWCEKVVKGLACTDSPPVIVSGLALGTDITAHRCAVENGIPTIGVMATGADCIYPARHSDFAALMVSTPGCALVTDYPPETAPLAIHFLRRNRIIAGLSNAVILIESKTKGGGMMTCRLAFSYNRDVYSLPGRVNDIRSQGCNELIRQKIAEPITSIEQLTQSLGMKCCKQKKVNLKELIHLTYGDRVSEKTNETLTKLLTQIKYNSGITIEELAETCHYDYNTTFRLINMMEIDGFVSVDLLQRCSIKTKKL